MEYSTRSAEPLERGRYWREVISQAYFPLELKYRNESTFAAKLKGWSLGMVSVSRLECDGIMYRRHARQLLAEREKNFLITIPDVAEVGFKQENRETRCAPGGFLVERGDAPYDFWHGEKAALWVIKAPSSALRARVGPPERLSALTFDATRGIGACFIDMIRTTAPRLDEMDSRARETIGQHIVDLLCLAIQNDDRVLDSHTSSVRAAHLYRAEQYVRSNLNRSELLPQDVADACGISLRYLQHLFTETGRSICEWIREQRLLICDEELRKQNSNQTISEIAYLWGFTDQSQFSKHYRLQFGRTPSEARAQYRMISSGSVRPMR